MASPLPTKLGHSQTSVCMVNPLIHSPSMLKLSSSSACLQTHAQHALAQSILWSCLRVAAEPLIPSLRELNSLRGLVHRSPSLGMRAFVCSSGCDEAEALAPAEAKATELEAETGEKSSGPIVSSNPPPEDYSTVATHGNARARSCSAGDSIDPCVIMELVSRQEWSRLRPLVRNPTILLQQLLDSGMDPEDTVRYFHWSEEVYKLTHSIELTCKLLSSLIAEGRYSKARSFLYKFVKNRERHSISSIFHTISSRSISLRHKVIIADILMGSYAKNRKTQLALEAFKRACDYRYKLSFHSCNALLSNLVREKATGDVEWVYKELIRGRGAYNEVTFNTVINGLCKAGKLNEAGDVIEDMKACGISPNVITYNTLIDGYCKMGRPNRMYKADAIFKDMIRSGITPSEVTYNTMINGFYKDGNHKAALQMFDEMQQKEDLKPNVYTYNLLIHGLCMNGDIKKAVNLRDEMLHSGLKMNIVTYNVLINGLSRNKLLKEAREMLDDIEKEGLVPQVITFNTLIDAYIKRGMIDEAFSIRDLMLAKGISPDVSTYNCLIGGLHKEGKIESVRSLMQEMVEKGLKADVITYHVLISSLCNQGRSRKASKLLDDMLNLGLNPTHVTYNTLMDGYCKEGNLRAALKVRELMERRGMRANTATYNVLIRGYCKQGKLEDANALLNEMLEKGRVMNNKTFEIVKQEMVEKGFVPDIEGHLYNVS